MVIVLNQGRFPGVAKEKLTQAAAALMVSGQASDCLFLEDAAGNDEFRVRDSLHRPIYAVRRSDGRYVLTDAQNGTIATGSLYRIARLMT